jgi:trk system potassium uptake protein TrkH
VRIFRRFRENIKLFIWDYIDIVQNTLRYISISVSLFTLATIAYYYGYQQTEESALICKIIIQSSLIFYVIKYILSSIFSIHSFRYIKKNAFQGIMVFLIVVWFILSYIFKIYNHIDIFSRIEVANIENITIVLIQLYFFIMVLFDLSSIGTLFSKFKLGPGGWMIASFFFLISLGTLLLLLPEMTVGEIRFIDALFTSTSACCITGLTVVETSNAFTFKGQFVIMLLMQMGGINILSFATYLSSSFRGKTLRHQFVMKEMLKTSLHGTKPLIKEIFIYTFIIEIIGAIVLFFYYNYYHFYNESLLNNVFFSFFHSISAFNNAGFSIVEGGMTSPVFHNQFSQYVIAGLIFLGSIGFLAINDITHNIFRRKTKQSLWSRLQIMTKLSVAISVILILIGAVSFFIFEYNNVSAGSSISDRICTAIFSAVSSRTAGYATVDHGLLTTPTVLIIMLLMFIGAAPTSTGGGVKTSTFYIILKSALATIKGKKEVTIYNRSIPFNLVDRSYAVVLFTLSLIFIGTLILSISDPVFSLKEVMYEVVSAIGTVGLSLGITSQLSIIGKTVIIILMFVGRVTVLTLALSIVRRSIYTNYSLAKADINI